MGVHPPNNIIFQSTVFHRSWSILFLFHGITIISINSLIKHNTIRGEVFIWLMVYLPLWKVWVRQLGWFFPIYGKIKAMFQRFPNHQPVTFGETHGQGTRYDSDRNVQSDPLPIGPDSGVARLAREARNLGYSCIAVVVLNDSTWVNQQFLWHLLLPIGSMYGIYSNIGGILMVNVTIYTIHGSYGLYMYGKSW